MSISSPGIGSGLDVQGIVSQLVELERRPVAQLQTTKTRLNTQLSSYGLMQSYMGNLQSISDQLGKASSWTRIAATSSDSASVGVSGSATATAGNYSLEVGSLATSQALASGVIANTADIGTGTLSFTRAGVTVDVLISAGQTSLQAVRDKINSSSAGVTAEIIMDAGGARLVLTGTETGTANAVSISVSNATGTLGDLAYPAGSMAETRAAANASFKLNGLQLSSASNTLKDVISGVTLTLSAETTTPVKIKIGQDTAALTKSVNDFVSAYNELNRFLAAQTKYDEASKSAGPLQGDSTAVGLQRKLRTMLQSPSGGSEVFARWSDLGVSLQRDGLLKVDADKLATALQNPAEVAKAMGHAGNGLAVGFKALADGMLGVEGALTSRSSGLRDSLKRNEREQTRVEERATRARERLLRQYGALDNSLNQLNGLGSFVSQQITNWNKSTGG
jgi:flagellar hook-associated protein 2